MSHDAIIIWVNSRVLFLPVSHVPKRRWAFWTRQTLQQIYSHFYWRDMTKHIKEYVNTCEQCQKANPKMIKETAVLHPIPIKTEVWHQIGIDLVGPLKLTRRGNRYVLFISCILLLVGCL